MYELGQKVMFDSNKIGYVVGINIDPLKEHEIANEKSRIMYIIRVYTNYSLAGYRDFYRTAKDIGTYE